MSDISNPKPNSNNNVKKDIPKYKQLKLREQVLLRPDTYIGSVEVVEQLDTVLKDAATSFSVETVRSNDGLLHLFKEILSNSIDNVSRSRERGVVPKYIKVEFNKEKQELSVKNDGIEIPLDEHSSGVPIPQLIFGTLLTSNNYDDTEEDRKTGGRNGYGSKLTNIFSKKFNVEIFNSEAQEIYRQEWRDNMSVMKDPKTRSKTGKTGYTKISWIADLSRFGLTEYTPDIIDQIRKRVADAAMITGISCHFNKERYNFKKIYQYAQFHHQGPKEIISFTHLDSDVAIILTPDAGFTHTSFVNGIHTRRGGVHIDKWCELLFRPVITIINRKKEVSKGITLTDVKKHFAMYVNTWVDKPQFSSQNKEYLTRPVPKSSITKAIERRVIKCGIQDIIMKHIHEKEIRQVSAQDKKQRRKKRSINIDDANKAGTKLSSECLLLITEGKSAKTFASAGIEVGIPFNDKMVKGRDKVGFLTLTGKILNVENASMKQISANTAINELKQALGAELNVDYTQEKNFKKLRYGGIVILTDADVDGDHIKGLLLLCFKKLWPSILNTRFVSSMLTPIGRIIFPNNRKNLVFYDETNFRKWIKENARTNVKFKVKYYKGLGTSSSDEVLEIFGRRMVFYEKDENSDFTFNKVFNSSESNARKMWIREATEKHDVCSEVDIKTTNTVEDVQDLHNIQSHTDFLDKDLIKYSISSCARSLPSVVDGLKESTRKVLHGALLKGKEVKVSQLAGFVSEQCHYQHGEQNLPATIIGLGQAFVGSNNLPLLHRGGQFGSRISNGSDAANGRYVTTKPDELTRNIFIRADEYILDYRSVDGECVEPTFFTPVIPMILVNGVSGIGTGWSSTVPCYNPDDVIANTRAWIARSLKGTITKDGGEYYTEMVPWYRGFKGSIIKDKDSDVKYICTGIMNIEKKNKIHVSELPIGMSTDQFRDHLEKLREKGKIVSFDNNSNVVDVEFTIILSPGETLAEKELKLITYVSTNNMTVFDADGTIRELKTTKEIFNIFCPVRLSYYKKRKDHEVSTLEERYKLSMNRCRFITEIVNGTLNVMGKKMVVLEAELVSKGYDKKKAKINVKRVLAQGTVDVDHETVTNGTYKYLLDIPVRYFTVEEIEREIKEKERLAIELVNRKALSPEDDWIRDLDNLSAKIEPWFKAMATEDDKLRGKVQKKKKTVKRIVKVKKLVKNKK